MKRVIAHWLARIRRFARTGVKWAMAISPNSGSGPGRAAARAFRHQSRHARSSDGQLSTFVALGLAAEIGVS
jgi:hypothetical protein